MYDENFLHQDIPRQTRRADDATVLLIAHKLEALHEDVGAMKDVLKELTSAITKLALIEERQAQAALAQERAFKVLEKIEARVDKLEEAAPINNQAASTVNKVMWVIVAAVLGALLMKLGLK